MKRIPLLVLAAMALVPHASFAPPPCHPLGPPCPTPSDPDFHTVAVVASSFNPQHLEEVHYGKDRVSFYNLDTVDHTVTDARCLDEDTATSCAFDIQLRPFAGNLQWYQYGANVVSVSAPHDFVVGETYGYACRIHANMTGSFTVVQY